MKQVQNAVTQAFGTQHVVIDLTYSRAHMIRTNMKVELAIVVGDTSLISWGKLILYQDRRTPDGALPPIIVTPYAFPVPLPSTLFNICLGNWFPLSKRSTSNSRPTPQTPVHLASMSALLLLLLHQHQESSYLVSNSISIILSRTL